MKQNETYYFIKYLSHKPKISFRQKDINHSISIVSETFVFIWVTWYSWEIKVFALFYVATYSTLIDITWIWSVLLK